MSTKNTEGIVSASVIAGHIEATGNRNEQTGHQIWMGRDLFIHIKPDVARQWIGVLETIAAPAE